MDWNFSLANYGPVWSFLVQLGLLMIFLLAGNIMRRKIPLFRKCLVPSALLGGAMLLIVNIIGKQFDFVLVDNRMMQVITYHCLAIGFAAMTLKTEKSTHKTKRAQVFEFGALQGGTYMLQAFVGLGLTIVLFLITRHGEQVISYVCGLILPLAFGQGPGNALSWDINFTNSIAWGFNFLWASLAAMLIKAVVKGLRKGKLMQREYINNYQMDRISGFAFDIMIVAGVAAIEINDIKDYIFPIIILSILGAILTYAYIRKASQECFPGFEHEMFLMSYGTLTGTASNGVILMKEIDPNLRTPTSSLYILSNFPAMVMIAPLLLLLGFAGKSLTNAIIACAIFFTLWLIYTIFLFRRRIFKKKYANKPVEEWKDEE